MTSHNRVMSVSFAGARSIVLDADSTLCGIEGIDWLATLRPPAVADEIARLTREAMDGALAACIARTNSAVPGAIVARYAAASDSTSARDASGEREGADRERRTSRCAAAARKEHRHP